MNEVSKVQGSYSNNNSLQIVTSSGKIEALLDYCKPIAESGISPFRDPGQVAAVALWSLDKDINLIDALSHAFILNGKIAIDSHLIRGLLQKAGVTHKYLKNYKKIYNYIFKDQVYEQEDIDSNPEMFKIFFNIDALKEWRTNNPDKKAITTVLRSAQPIDIVTEIEFTRIRNNKVTTHVSSFSIKDAEVAGLLTKTNWQNYPKLCLAARAYVIGAREIADDIIFGMYNPDELGFDGISKVEEVTEAIDYVEVE